jgi:hypothetical protein
MSDGVDTKTSVVQFTKFHVCFLLETLYDDLCKNEKMLSESALLENSFEKMFFSTEDPEKVSRKSLAGECSSSKFKIVGPLGERPLHICFLRANNFPQLVGFEEGVMEGIKAFINNAGEALQGEIDTPYGKDYCARIGHVISIGNLREFPPLVIGSAEMETDLPEPPYLNDIRRWANHIARRRPHAGEYDPKVLTTCGIYEGQTPLFMAIADANIGMLRWLLGEAKAR